MGALSTCPLDGSRYLELLIKLGRVPGSGHGDVSPSINYLVGRKKLSLGELSRVKGTYGLGACRKVFTQPLITEVRKRKSYLAVIPGFSPLGESSLNDDVRIPLRCACSQSYQDQERCNGG